MKFNTMKYSATSLRYLSLVYASKKAVLWNADISYDLLYI